MGRRRRDSGFRRRLSTGTRSSAAAWAPPRDTVAGTDFAGSDDGNDGDADGEGEGEVARAAGEAEADETGAVGDEADGDVGGIRVGVTTGGLTDGSGRRMADGSGRGIADGSGSGMADGSGSGMADGSGMVSGVSTTSDSRVRTILGDVAASAGWRLDARRRRRRRRVCAGGVRRPGPRRAPPRRAPRRAGNVSAASAEGCRQSRHDSCLVRPSAWVPLAKQPHVALCRSLHVRLIARGQRGLHLPSISRSGRAASVPLDARPSVVASRAGAHGQRLRQAIAIACRGGERRTG